MLHQNEWQIAIVLWTAIAGATIGSLANAERLFPLPFWAVWFVAAFYGVVAWAYLFGFCAANYKSLTEERSRYRYFQNKAMALLSAESNDLIKESGSLPRNAERTEREFVGSSTWRFKLRSTYLAQSASLSIMMFLNTKYSDGSIPAVANVAAVAALWGMGGIGLWIWATLIKPAPKASPSPTDRP